MTPIRTAVLTLATAAVLLVAAKCAFGAECMPSAEAVWAAHPGTKWATRHTSHGEQCWEAGRHHKTAWRNRKTREGVSPASADNHELRRPGSNPGAVTIPLPHEKPWKLVLFNDFQAYFIVYGH